MNHEPESGDRDETDGERQPIPAIPADQPIIPNYMAGEGPRMVTLRRMPALEAEMARAKLEAEGIPCIIADARMSEALSLVVPDARLQVAETDVPLAEEILSRPAAAGADGEYADEEFRCPKCHRRAVDLMPLSPGARRARNGFLLLAGAQIAGLLLRAVIPAGELAGAIDWLMSWECPAWILAFVLGLGWMLSSRDKRCRDCGHPWGATVAAASTDTLRP
jgi:hypothetical protein